MFNPILTGLFESMQVFKGDPPPPPSSLRPEWADHHEILHGCEDTCKEYCYKKIFAENGLFIIL